MLTSTNGSGRREHQPQTPQLRMLLTEASQQAQDVGQEVRWLRVKTGSDAAVSVTAPSMPVILGEKGRESSVRT